MTSEFIKCLNPEFTLKQILLQYYLCLKNSEIADTVLHQPKALVFDDVAIRLKN